MHANNGSSHGPTFDYEEIIFSNLEHDEDNISSNALIAFAQRLAKRLGVKVVTQPVSEEEDDECEFDLRVTDVPEDVLATNTEPDLLELRLATLGKSVWQRTPHKRILTRLLLLVLVVLLVCISTFGHTLLNLFPLSSPTPTTSFTRSETFYIPVHRTEPNIIAFKPNKEVTVTARNIPHYCPASVMLGQGRQIGNFPVWMSGIDSATTPVHLPALTLKTLKGWKGWIIPLHVSAKYGYQINIALTTFNTYGSSTPLLQNPDGTPAASHLFIDTQHPMSFADAARKIGTWDISLYLPSAGCYAINASWGQGHWQINFAAGQ